MINNIKLINLSKIKEFNYLLSICKQIKYIVLPYHNNKVDAISSKLTKLVNSSFKNLELRVAFQTPNKI